MCVCVFDGVRVFSKHFALSLPSYHKFCFVSGQADYQILCYNQQQYMHRAVNNLWWLIIYMYI